MRFHFSATARQDTDTSVGSPEIDLNLEISEKGDPAGAGALSGILDWIGQPSLQPIGDKMTGLTATLKPSAYGRLAYSRPTDQTQDRINWEKIHDAAARLMDLDFVKPWTYSDWGRFNSYCNSGNPDRVPDRRNPGNPAAVPSAFWGNYRNQASFIQYFFLAATDGMNLFEDLVTLANDLESVTTEAQWQAIRARVVSIVKGDANIDYAKPIAAAILAMAAQGGAQVSASTTQGPDSGTFTATVTLA